MKSVILVVFVFFVTKGVENFEFDGGINFNKPYLFVSLGCNCWQAQALRSKAHGLRDAAFPFDWLLTFNNDLVIKCLDEKFKHFCDASQLRRYGKTHVENIYYNFQFTHDWAYRDEKDSPQRYKEQLEFIKNKYTRRINRFDSIRDFKGKVFFVRCLQVDPKYKGENGWNAQNAINLNNALRRYFPDLNFTLVIVSCTDLAVSEIGYIPGIKEYKVKDLTAENFTTYYTMYKDLVAEFLPGF